MFNNLYPQISLPTFQTRYYELSMDQIAKGGDGYEASAHSARCEFMYNGFEYERPVSAELPEYEGKNKIRIASDMQWDAYTFIVNGYRVHFVFRGKKADEAMSFIYFMARVNDPEKIFEDLEEMKAACVSMYEPDTRIIFCNWCVKEVQNSYTYGDK